MANDANLEVVLKIRDLATSALTKFEKTTGRAAKKSEKAFGGAERAVDSLKRGILQLGGAMAAVFAVRKIGQSLISFEQGLVGVGKTADIQGAALERLGDDFIFLSRKIPVAVNQLLDIGRAAGQLGVKGSASILKFTETVARLAAASADFQGEEAATTLARFLTVSGEGVEDVDRLASTIVQLGNTTAATEREIALAGLSVSAATAQFDIGAAQAAAFGAALSQLGVQTDLAGSTIGRTFQAIDSALRDGGKAADRLVKLTGKSVKELSEIFQRDAVEGFDLFLGGLRGVIEEGGNAKAVLEDLGLADIRILKVLPVLAKNQDFLNRKLEESIKEWEANIALLKESERAYSTLGGAITRFGNTITAAILGIRGGTDALSDMAWMATGVLEQFFGMEKRVVRASMAIVDFTAALKIGTALLIGLATPKILAFFAVLGKAIWGATAALIGLNAAARVNPFIMVISFAAVAATAIGLFSLEAANAQDELKKLGEAAAQFGTTIDRIELANVMLELARETGNVQQRIQALKGSIKEFQDIVDAFDETGRVDRGIAFMLLVDTSVFDRSTKDVANQIKTRLGKMQDELRPLLKLAIELQFDETGKAVDKTTKAIDKMALSLRVEALALRVGMKDQDAANVVRAVGANIIDLETAAIDGLLPKLVDLVLKFKAIRQVREQQKASADLKAFLGQMDMERKLIGKTAEEAWVLTTVQKRLNLEKAAGKKITEEFTAEVQKEVEALGRLKFAQDELSMGFAAGFGGVVEQFDTSAKRLTIAGADTANALLNAFTIDFFDPMTGKFRDLGEIGRSILGSLLSAFSQIASRFAAMSILGGLGVSLPGLAKGGAIADGRLIPAAKGLVMSQPTILGIGSGKGVLAAERHRKEAVLPLATTSSGDLGVQSVGGGGGSGDVTFNYAPVIHAPQDTDLAGLDRIMRDSEGRMNNWWMAQMAKGGKVRSSLIRTVRTA